MQMDLIQVYSLCFYFNQSLANIILYGL